MKRIYDEQSMRFEITEDKLKMEISIDDLCELFESHPWNYEDEDGNVAVIKEDKKEEFVRYVVEKLLDQADTNEDCILWGIPFDNTFSQILEDSEDFCNYNALSQISDEGN